MELCIYTLWFCIAFLFEREMDCWEFTAVHGYLVMAIKFFALVLSVKDWN